MADHTPHERTIDDAAKSRMRTMFGLGKERDVGKVDNVDPHDTDSSPSAAATTMPPPSSTSQAQASAGGSHPLQHAPESTSPRLASQDSSQIFERDVQESALASELSPAIPAHIQTDDHIPAVLEASSLAITDSHLGPDEVEIVTHPTHHSAAETVAESAAHPMQSSSRFSLSGPEPHHDNFSASFRRESDDTASNYGTLDPNDVRRLSFISFADVVQAEHAADSQHHPHLSSSSFQSIPPGVKTPPTASQGANLSPGRSPRLSPAGSPPPASGASHQHGELNIETMRQALRKTGSGDLSAARSQHHSAVNTGEGVLDKNPFRS